MAANIGNLHNDLLLRVALGEKVGRPPVWLMRQAGRFLTEYREVRKKAGSFRAMIAHPELAAEVTLQPVDLLQVDAAIIFSDILVVPEAMGLPYEMVPGSGPHFPQTLRTLQDLAGLRPVSEAPNLEHTYEAIRQVIRALDQRVPLIGFAGAPWTIFCYMTEGSGSKTFSVAKALLYRDPVFAHALLEKITEATIQYLRGQITAGVHIVQLFDSWAGILGEQAYAEFALPYLDRICREVQEVPRIVFAKGAFYALKALARLDAQVIGLDWQTHPRHILPYLGTKALQGNMDPCQLYASPAQVADATREMIRAFPAGRHIVNLGHGMYPDIPRESVIAMIETVKQFTYPEY